MGHISDPNFFPARIHVLLATKAPSALIIRRGPSQRFCTLGWNLSNDTLTMGQWLKGRIYERRSDLSPDGKHFLYFIFKGDDRKHLSWTAISRAPYLKATGFWPKGDAWFGGGLFLDTRQFWINGFSTHSKDEARFNLPLKHIAEWPEFEYFGGECEGVYFLRLLRDGWKHQGRTRLHKWHDVTRWEKTLNENFKLLKFAHATIDHQPGKGCYYDEHQLVNIRTGEEIDGKDWEWADFDKTTQRLLWSRAGKIFARTLGREPGKIKELFDLNQMEFEPIAAPY